MIEVRYLQQARLDVLDAIQFYESQAAGLGGELLDEIDHAIAALQQSPKIGSSYSAGTRRIVLRRFPFTLVYDVHADWILIVAVAHQRRKPGYWRVE